MKDESQGVRTSLYSILCIVIRLGAVMLAWSSIEKLTYLLAMGQWSAFPTEDKLLAWIYFGSAVLISVLLWLYPGPIARLASGRSAQQIFDSPILASEMQWIALSVLGLYWIMTGLLDLANLGYQYVWMSDTLGSGEAALQRLQGQIAYDVFEIVLGLSVTLGARGLANFLQKVRYAGSSGMTVRKPSTSEDGD